MRELLYTVLELEEWLNDINNLPCEFCVTSFSNENRAVCQIKTRNPITHKLVAIDFACQKCKERFESGEMPKCERCGRLRIKSDTDFITGKYVCRCIERGEDTEEKELPVLPHLERESTFYERQINALREEKEQLSEEVDTHLEALEVSEVWNKRQKQELLDEIKSLKEEVKQLREQVKAETYEKEITELEAQLEQLNSQQQTAQVEVKEVKKWSWKLRK